MARLGIDIGGTFTDLVLVTDDGEIITTKVPSTPDDRSAGAINAIEKSEVDPSIIDVFNHGTTVATNVIIERNPGARTVFLTNDGFADIPEIMRTERENQYDRQWEKPDPLVPRNDRHGVPGRVTVTGEEDTPLDEAAARNVIRSYTAEEETITYAISMLYSFLDPSHERALTSIIEEEDPEAFVSVSFDIFPQAKEYERASTVIANAYVKPSMQRYVLDLEEQFGDIGGNAPISIMQSNGGVIPVGEALAVPAKTLFSGPAAGVAGANYFGSSTSENIISIDMGGTSTDVGLIRGGDPVYTTQGEIEWGIPVQFPQMDIKTVGAGGGSIAWIDAGGLLRVGPRSAGADPGPVCYGRGGTDPTITDANLVLGRLNPGNFLGGDVALDVDATWDAIATLGEQLDMTVQETALGILEIGMNTMTQAIRTVSVERGYDPRDFTLVAFGGAGPMHAAKVCGIANIPRVVIPPNPGVLSAAGLLTTDFRYDQLQSFIKPIDGLDADDVDEINRIIDELVTDGLDVVKDQETLVSDIAVELEADLRYLKQAYEVTVPLADDPPVRRADIDAAEDRFHDKHEQLYGHSSQDDDVEVVNILVNIIGDRDAPDKLTSRFESPEATMDEAIVDTRSVMFQEGEFETPIYDRERLATEGEIEAPFILEEDQSTTVGFPGQVATVLPDGNVIIQEANR